MSSSLPDKRLTVLSAVILATYAIRVTIPSVWIYPVAPSLINFSAFAALILTLIVLIFLSDLRFNEPGILLLVLIAITIIYSVDYDTAMIRTILWALVFIVAGPLLLSQQAFALRNYLWEQSHYLIIAITLLSFAWILSGLPQYGKGTSGVTMHCMLLSALAGLASVISFNNLFSLTSRSLLGWLIFSVSALTCIMSSSRTALLAAVAGCAAVLVMKLRDPVLRIMAFAGMILFTFLLWSFFNLGNSDLDTINASSGVTNPYTKEIILKGHFNSRQQLWDNRIEEFMEYPASGVGIGVDTFASSVNAFGASVIEPGSSYLAVLSMTGILGAMGMMLLLLSLFSQVLKRSYLIPDNDLIQMVSIGAFWSIHGVAEGWIFAGGSLLCLLFWIWVGRLANLAGTVPEGEEVSP